jgi:hypothetical protein
VDGGLIPLSTPKEKERIKMIKAKEAHEISKGNDLTTVRKKEVLNILFPTIEKTIKNVSSHGIYSAAFKQRELIEMLPIELKLYFTNNEIINILDEEMKKFGYAVKIPNSYTSIKFSW